MSIPGYDDWKLRTPEDEYEASGGKICPFCGAYSRCSCEFEEEIGCCLWEESEPEPDPDYLRDPREDRP